MKRITYKKAAAVAMAAALSAALPAAGVEIKAF